MRGLSQEKLVLKTKRNSNLVREQSLVKLVLKEEQHLVKGLSQVKLVLKKGTAILSGAISSKVNKEQ